MQRYSRQIILPEITTVGQNKIKNAKVAVVGAGGLGSPVLLYLASAGVGNITFFDDDVVDLSNLQRQVLFSNADEGCKKAEVATIRLKELNPDINITGITKRVDYSNIDEILDGFDIVLDGSDNFDTRYLVNDFCVKTKTPLVFGAITGFEGQLGIFNHGENSPCYRCIYPKEPLANIRTCADAGVIGPIAGIVGSMMALEAIKIIVNSKSLKPISSKLLVVDGRTMDIRTIPAIKRDDCSC